MATITPSDNSSNNNKDDSKKRTNEEINDGNIILNKKKNNNNNNNLPNEKNSNNSEDINNDMRKKIKSVTSSVVGPRSAYAFFMKEYKHNVMQRFPNISKNEHRKLTPKVWNQLSSEERQKYQEKADLDKIRYSQEVELKLIMEQNAAANIANATAHANTKSDTNKNQIVTDLIAPNKPIGIAKNLVTNKYIFPKFTKDDTLNARMFLKYYGSRKFLDSYLPEELNSLYLYFLIRLLGFELKDSELTKSIYKAVQEEDTKVESSLTYVNIDDPLSKKQTIRLIKDLQRAINKVLASRLRIVTFSTIDNFVSRLQNAKNIIVLTGAGVSTSLGIPDFRSSEGFYSRVKYLGLNDPQDVFNYELFKKEPSIFYSIANMILPPENVYSPLHSFIKMLSDKGKLLRNYTQNIDNLESYAHIPADKLVHCHGSFASATCVTCDWKVPGTKIFKNIRNIELPICPNCYKERVKMMELYNPYVSESVDLNTNSKKFSAKEVETISNIKSFGVLKPDITFFGEPLPERFFQCLMTDMHKCDLLICIGTSLKVAPVSDIVNMIPAQVPQVLINRDPVRHADFDLSLLGFCDDIAGLVTKRCGWEFMHKDWEKLSGGKYDILEQERGVYSVKRENSSV
ncbi:similar to Saccharomyces cerevisiae YDL042C SIR2 Conserved NAD+ dependent histone deacetylase of the Sirtuin family involved in regulation of lifespan [Maudiozyma saulgeensis]|uniref:Similar to Saccharomyces cerevisiae YDL042C SIR2 Conserved NAD+ dependent histone deacetylase of the Sirtuin family involved in regulation of lifespan n=1 Tax=Maudiozyma saulgeensis TaxID=1789683 RepID=A0A1X7R445_9SACH|nr:similar to Saccharomyces cerevisiae YDL042C SIR2 Conserved NAD+ dependent histone deacetylase of the Sirtuin family involved in regulation of lifespan [Kazachstania saulgeensis]